MKKLNPEAAMTNNVKRAMKSVTETEGTTNWASEDTIDWATDRATYLVTYCATRSVINSAIDNATYRAIAKATKR